MESRFHISRAELKHNTRKNEHESGKKIDFTCVHACKSVRMCVCMRLSRNLLIQNFNVTHNE